MRKRRKASFEPKKFLAQVGEGKTIAKYQRGQIVFSQGDVADAVFYIQKGKVKLTVISEKGSRNRNLRTWSLLWRRVSEWPWTARRNNCGVGRMCHHSYRQIRHDRCHSS